MTVMPDVRCLTCLREGYHVDWCPDAPARMDDTLIGGPEMAVQTRTTPRGAPRWALACVATGAILSGVALVGMAYREPFGLWVLMMMNG